MAEWVIRLQDVLREWLPGQWAQHGFMLNALLILAALAPLCAALGVKVVNFRMAFFSDAISHSAFTGVILGFVAVRIIFTDRADIEHWDRILPPITLVVFGLLVAAGITALRKRTELSADTVIGVFFATVIALGIALMSRLNLESGFAQYLWGSVITASETDVCIAWGLAALGLLAGLVQFNRLLLIGLNPELAASRRVRVRLHEYLFAGLLALVVTLSIRSVGLLLVTALLVVPAAAARNLARSAGAMLRWAVLIGLVCGVGGLIGSYYFDTYAGAAVILCASAVFVLSVIARTIRARL